MKKTFSNFYAVIAYRRIITGLEKKMGWGDLEMILKIFFRNEIFKMYVKSNAKRKV